MEFTHHLSVYGVFTRPAMCRGARGMSPRAWESYGGSMQRHRASLVRAVFFCTPERESWAHDGESVAATVQAIACPAVLGHP